MIRNEVVDEILLRNDIESLIGSYISLKRAGGYLKGLCPFHNEKTPSFVVYPQDNSFYCFGCGIGGNAITFIRQIEHLDYPDAVEFLAKRAGITVVYDNDNSNYFKNKKVDKKRYLQMNVDAARFFNAQLFADNENSRMALNYFTKVRGLSVSLIKHFGLGYAPNSFDALKNYMLSKGYDKDELVDCFLLGKSQSGTYFDSFRNRVMFPIIDITGNVIAFGGRVMDDSKPKYKNSSDTPVFKKSRNLFALNFAKNYCKDTMILCEGYMDVIALHSAGFNNAVATLGTAITAEQARLMSRYTKKVLISYDADEAGQMAAKKAMKLLTDVGLDVSVIVVPDAKDPDEFIKTFGKEKFNKVISSSKSKFEYNMDNILSKYNINLPQDRVNALNELEKMISEFYSKAEIDVYIQQVASKLQVEFKSVKTDVERIIRKRISAQLKTEAKNYKESSMGYGDKINPDFIKAPSVAKNEESVLGLLLVYPEHRKLVFTKKLLSKDDFFTELNKRIFEALETNFLNGTDGRDINEFFTPEEVGRIVKMKISRMSLTENGEDVLFECIDSLKKSIDKKYFEKIDNISQLKELIESKRNN